jgi:hypothetical protein
MSLLNFDTQYLDERSCQRRGWYKFNFSNVDMLKGKSIETGEVGDNVDTLFK